MATFIVCGLHRSGTTFVGKILQQAGVVVVHEPLNERFGMRHVPIAYPYVAKINTEFSGLLNDALFFSRSWNKDTQHIQSAGLKKMIYAWTGGRSGMRWGMLRIQKIFGCLPNNICLKDPFMSLGTPYLVKEHKLSVVCLVRHPAAIHYSTDKQAWRFDVQNLRQQTELIKDVAFDISNQHWNLADKHAAASIAVLWKVMVRINQQLAKESSCLKVVKHEDLCLYPLEVAKSICGHFNIPFTESIESFVTVHSQGSKTEAEPGKVHDFKRNSKALVDSWRGRLSSFDEQLMKDIVGGEVEAFYGSW